MIDLDKFAIGVDVWDGTGDPDWVVLKANGCQFAFLRMNESDGSLRLDKQFHNWPAAAGLARGVYVVISPFISRQAYVQWILSSKPSDCMVIALDVEIAGSTMAAYSALVIGVASDLQAAGCKVLLYSGGWFYGYVSPWPSQFDQWWARYPSVLYPAQNEHITWDVLKAKLTALQGYLPLAGQTIKPGHVAIWQVTSRYILPGGPANWPIDINLMPVADFERIWGKPAPSLEERVTALEAWVKAHG